ncbi:ADAMTS-like protein 5 isoform X7 [Sciurus carolinensis]|uniref:ADAMTS-like protein 5 isoform X7 n=1 Tax=Sciurus carolinensis TaxID=30640 RepID=UPI001FB3EF19|nr:ADAMTS-like protein 5 isoform X7 [Sciurus carolinensis]
MGFSVCLAGTRCMGPLCSHRPRPSQSLLLLLWTLLNCVLGSGAQGPGEWTPWGSWSRCSSSCGRGVSVRSRRCIRFPGEESCSGISHEYRLCQLPDCPPGAVPFRDIQCALYNGRPVLGTQKTYQWIPFHGELTTVPRCLPDGAQVGGTGSPMEVTISLTSVSSTQPVRSQLSGGGTCLLSQLWPCPRRHPLQPRCPWPLRGWPLPTLMGVDGRYVLNGNWEVSPPGTYEAAGTRVVYARAAAPEETLRATGPTSQDLLLQILLQEPNPGIQFEFWLPRERYGPFQLQTQARGWPVRQRQPQLREVEPRPLEGPTAPPALIPTLAPGEAGRSGWGRQRVRPVPLTAPPPTDPCPPCPDTRGRAHRLLHYCGSDFVFQARVLGRHRQAQETRYEVRIQLIYKNRGPLRSQEYVWAPGHCPCPPLAPHQEYLLAIRRLLSPDGTQDRLLLPHAGYARPWSPAEDSRIRLAARRCPP